MSQPPDAVVRAAQQSDVKVAPAGETTLQRLRDRIAWFRGRQTEKHNLEEQLKAVNVEIYQAERKELPDLLDEARVPRITVQMGEGEPAVEVRAQPYYKANIAAEWEPDRRAAAFGWLDANGHGDLIKTDVTLSFAREDRAFAVAFAQWLRSIDVAELVGLLAGNPFIPQDLIDMARGKNSPVMPGVVARENVPWNTLTKWLQDMVENQGETPPLDTIGGEVGRIVKLKEI